MKHQVKKYFLLTLAFLTMQAPLGVQADSSSISLEVNGESMEQAELLLIEGRTYVPVREVMDLLGAEVSWNEEDRAVILEQGNNNVVFEIGEHTIYRNDKEILVDAPAIINQGLSYVPVRFVSEALQYDIEWQEDTNTIEIAEKPTYIVEEGDTLGSISITTGISVEKLKVWNGLEGDIIQANDKLYLEGADFSNVDKNKATSVISYTNEELDLLATIIHAEANDEPYEGLVAVGAVIVNRVQSPRWPDSITGVVYQPYQFTPVKTGRIKKVKPDQTAYKAAKEALQGKNPIGDAMFFFNPKVSTNPNWSKYTTVKEIGGHRFVKR